MELTTTVAQGGLHRKVKNQREHLNNKDDPIGEGTWQQRGGRRRAPTTLPTGQRVSCHGAGLCSQSVMHC